MSPSPADVGYRSSSLDAGRSRELSTSLPTKGSGLQWNDSSGGSSQSGVDGGGKGGRALSRTNSAEPVARGRPPPISTSLPSGSGSLVGGGPVNMPSSISVQELKQMTALRMAHEQGHLRVVSPFRFSVGGGKQHQQVNSRGSSPLKGERDRESGGGSNSNNIAHGRNAYTSRTPSRSVAGGGVGEGGSSAPEEGSQRPRRHNLEFLVAGSAAGGVSHNHNSSPGDIPPTPSSSSSGSSRSGGQRSRGSPSPQGRQSPGLAPSSGPGATLSSCCSSSSSSRTTPPTSSMPHGLTVQELKEMTKMRLAREAFNIPVYAVLRSSSQHPPDSKRSVGGGGLGSGVASRGRGASPASRGGRHPDGRGSGASSAVAAGRSSTPASPANGDRPHRRTRRGGRRGRNRSPRPDETFSPKRAGSRHLGMGMDSGGRGSVGFGSRDGFSSASPSRSRARWLLTEPHQHHAPWGDLDDEQPRSSSQPRAVICGDHHVFSGGDNREKQPKEEGQEEEDEDEEGCGGVSDGGGVNDGDDARGSVGSSFLGSPALSPVPDDGLDSGDRGGSGESIGVSIEGLAGGVRDDSTASGSGSTGCERVFSGGRAGGGGVRGDMPWEPRAGVGDGDGGGGVDAEEWIAEVGRHRHRDLFDGDRHRDIGVGRETGGKLERGMVKSGRSRTTAKQGLGRRNGEEHSRFRNKTDGGGGGGGSLIGPERTTTLRGFDPREEHASYQHRMHLHLHLHRASSSESVLVANERSRGSASDDPRYGHPQLNNHHDHNRHDDVRYSSGHHRHLYALENCDDHGGARAGVGVGVIGGEKGMGGGDGGQCGVFFGERYCDDDALRQQQQHRGHGAGGGGGIGSMPENHQDSARPLLLPGSVDRGGDECIVRFDSQQQQQQQRRQKNNSGSWNRNGSPSLPPQVPFLSSRRSDGGAVATVGSARGGLGGGVLGRNFGGFGGVHRGGLGGISSTDGVRDDISYTVAESVFVTPNNPNSSPQPWKSNRSQQQASAAEGGDNSWHVPSLAAGAVLTPQSFGVYEREHTGYVDEGFQHAYLNTSDDGEHRMPLKPHHLPHSAHQLGSHQKDYYRGDLGGYVGRDGTRDSSNNLEPDFGGVERFDASPSARRRGADAFTGGVRMEDVETAGRPDLLVNARGDSGVRVGVVSGRAGGDRGRLSSSYPSQSPMVSPARHPGRLPNPYPRDPFSVGGGHGSMAKDGNSSIRRVTPPSPTLAGSSGNSAVDGGGGSRVAISASSTTAGSDNGGGNGNGNGNSSSNSSPLMSGLMFSLELAGCPRGNISRRSSESNRGSSSDSQSFEFAGDGAGRSVNASPGSHRSSDSVDSGSVPSLPRYLDIGPSVGGVVGSSPRAGGGGVKGAETSLFSHGRGDGDIAENKSNSTTGCRLTRSMSSTLPAGRDRSSAHPGTIGSSRRNANNISSSSSSVQSSVHNSPLLGTTGVAESGSHNDFDVVFPGLEVSSRTTTYGEESGVVNAFGNMSVKEFFGVCSS